ncbi:MAG: cytochrome c [Nitrospinae bacterium]|nr:cytochrome c [Nitrospinota bacterium]
MKRIVMVSLIAALAVILAAAGTVSAAPKGAGSEMIYNTYCVQCHGLKRNGKGVNSPSMAVQPRDHTDAKAMGDVPEAQLFKAIKEGGIAVNKSPLMPAWGDVLTDEEINGLTAYLRQVCKCGSTNK